MKLSVVATLYKSAPYIEEFHARCTTVAKQLAGSDYEIVLVNDGSPDNSLDLAIAISEKDPRLVVVDLSRNFGHHKAIMTGLMHARGDLVYLLDSDLEEEPEWLLPFYEQLTAEGCDVVFGVQKSRKGRWFERWSGRVFYRLFSAATGVAVTANQAVARVMTRRYVDALTAFDEREVFFGGIACIAGFKQVSQPVVKHSTSATTYTLREKVGQSVNAITSFSDAPLKIISYCGLSISGLSILYVVYQIYLWLVHERPPLGWTSVMASIWLLGGLVISFLGIIGIYISKIFSETKRRPYAIVRHVYSNTRDRRIGDNGSSETN